MIAFFWVTLALTSRSLRTLFLRLGLVNFSFFLITFCFNCTLGFTTLGAFMAWSFSFIVFGFLDLADLEDFFSAIDLIVDLTLLQSFKSIILFSFFRIDLFAFKVPYFLPLDWIASTPLILNLKLPSRLWALQKTGVASVKLGLPRFSCIVSHISIPPILI